MPVLLKDYKLFYADVPKVACSSVKRMFFEIENGIPFPVLKANGVNWHIHVFYPGWLRQDFPEGQIANFRRLAIVRDPIKRFLSAYGNRVVFHKEASKQHVSKLGRFNTPKADPELDEFIDNFEKYRQIPSIVWHTRPTVDFLGFEPSYFHGLYGIHQMDEFVADVSNLVGKPVEVGRHQTGGPKFSKGDLTAKQLTKLEKYYKADYDTFSAYF